MTTANENVLENFQYDVLLAHNSVDKSQILALAEALRARGIRPWLDIWELPPGRPFQQEIERVLPKIKSVAVIVGSSGLGPWEVFEMRAAINQFVRRGTPVIPVILPGIEVTPTLPLFLQEFGWVKLTDGMDADDALDDLIWGITGCHPKRPQYR